MYNCHTTEQCCELDPTCGLLVGSIMGACNVVINSYSLLQSDLLIGDKYEAKCVDLQTLDPRGYSLEHPETLTSEVASPQGFLKLRGGGNSRGEKV